MAEFAKMDVFFVVTTIAVILVTVVLVITAIYIIKILGDVKYISKKAKAQTDLLAEDIEQLRSNVKQEGAKLKHLGKFLSGIYKRHKK